jgi:hypothetical protein
MLHGAAGCEGHVDAIGGAAADHRTVWFRLCLEHQSVIPVEPISVTAEGKHVYARQHAIDHPDQPAIIMGCPLPPRPVIDAANRGYRHRRRLLSGASSAGST